MTLSPSGMARMDTVDLSSGSEVYTPDVEELKRIKRKTRQGQTEHFAILFIQMILFTIFFIKIIIECSSS